MPDSPALNVAERLDIAAARSPDKSAIVFAQRSQDWTTCTYGQLRHRVTHIAHALESRNIHPGTRIAVMLPPGIDFVALAFAMLRFGLVPVLVDPAIGLRNVTLCLAQAAPEVYIGNRFTHALRRLYGWGRSSIRFNISMAALPRSGAEYAASIAPARVKADTEAAVIFTSGSTGLPKGAIYTHGNFAAILDILLREFSIGSDEVDLPAFPLFLMLDCLLGVTAIVPDTRFPSPANVDPAKIFTAAARFGATNMFASPIVLDRMATYGARNELDLHGLRRVITAGAPAPFRVLEGFSRLLAPEACLYGIYGATEALTMAVVEAGHVLNNTRAQSAGGKGICVGRPVSGATVRIMAIDDEPHERWDPGLELPSGVVGEITIMGPHVTPRYVGNQRANAMAKLLDANGIVHRTGDLGYFDEHGNLWYCGRKSHRVSIASGTLFTEQIEGIFNAHPAVHRSALVQTQGKPILWVQPEKKVTKRSHEQIVRELRELASRHPQAALIEHFFFLAQFPTDVRHNSKIIRERLADLAERRLR